MQVTIKMFGDFLIYGYIPGVILLFFVPITYKPYAKWLFNRPLKALLYCFIVFCLWVLPPVLIECWFDAMNVSFANGDVVLFTL